MDFVVNNPNGQKFLEWVKDTGVPDETFFSSLNVSPQLGVPGATTGMKEVWYIVLNSTIIEHTRCRDKQ